MTEPSAPAGWYPQDGGQRYWDGGAWTGAFVPATPVAVVQRDPYATNHVLHLLLTVFTFGLWAPVWLLVALLNDNRRTKDYRARLEAQRALRGIE